MPEFTPKGPSTRMFQITEDDLAVLEQTLPHFCWSNIQDMTLQQRKRFEACKAILSNVRWNYGPPREAVEMKAG